MKAAPLSWALMSVGLLRVDHSHVVCRPLGSIPEIRRMPVLAIAVLVFVLGGLGFLIWLIARQEARRVAPQMSIAAKAGDLPQLGPSMSWLAVGTTDVNRLISTLGLIDVQRCTLKAGVGSVYQGRKADKTIFVSSPVGGWTIVAGVSLPQPLGPAFVDKTTPLLLELSEAFGEAQYFASYPAFDHYAWFKVVNGRVVRAFATGDDGEIRNDGRVTAAEQMLGLKFFELRGVDGRAGDAGGAMMLSPTESQVLQLAARWSADPRSLGAGDGDGAESAACFSGLSPYVWRAERVSKNRAA